MCSVRLETLDLNLLRVFDALMQTRSVTAASLVLNLTQPSTSNALERLRRVADDQLLERVGNEMVPTQFAREFWPSVREALSVLRAGLAELEQFSPAAFDKKIRIGMDAYCISFIAPPLAERLLHEAPLCQLEILSAPPHEKEEELLFDGYDIVIGPTWRSTPKLAKKVLFREDMVVVMRENHALADGPLDAKSYAAAPHVLYSEKGIVTNHVDAALKELGLKRSVAVSLSFYPAVAEMLLRTNCIATLGRALAESIAQAPGIIIKEPPISVQGFDVSMLWAPRNTPSVSHQWLRKICEKVAISNEQRSFSAAI